MAIDERRSWARRALLDEVARLLEAHAIEDARRTAEWMLGDALGCGRAQLYAYGGAPVPAGQVKEIQAMVSRRLRREPVQYILGTTDFFGLRLRVTPAVLIPRPETEQLVEAALELLALVSTPKIVDAGTGSGCIALALKHARPDAAITGCDVSPEALTIAAENAQSLGLDVAFIEADMTAPGFADQVPGGLDLLISNPPYVPADEAATLAPEVRAYEPALALFSGADPLRFYRALAAQAAALLKRGGWLLVETHADYTEGVEALFAEHLTGVTSRRDLSGRPRMVMGRLG